MVQYETKTFNRFVYSTQIPYRFRIFLIEKGVSPSKILIWTCHACGHWWLTARATNSNNVNPIHVRDNADLHVIMLAVILKCFNLNSDFSMNVIHCC